MTCTKCANVQCYVCSKSCDYSHFNDARRGGKVGNCDLFDKEGGVEARHQAEVKAAEEEARKKAREEHKDLNPELLEFKESEKVKRDEAHKRERESGFWGAYAREAVNADLADTFQLWVETVRTGSTLFQCVPITSTSTRSWPGVSIDLTRSRELPQVLWPQEERSLFLPFAFRPLRPLLLGSLPSTTPLLLHLYLSLPAVHVKNQLWTRLLFGDEMRKQVECKIQLQSQRSQPKYPAQLPRLSHRSVMAWDI